MGWLDTFKEQWALAYDWISKRQLNSVFWVLVVFCLGQAFFYTLAAFKPDFMGVAAWELFMASGITVVISLLAMTAVFWILNNLESVRDIVLPSRDKASNVEDYLDSMDVPQWKSKEVQLFASLSRTRAARIVTVAIIYAVTLFVFSPLS